MRGISDFNERQDAKRDRLDERASKAGERSRAAYNGARAISSMIPMGQPILVGHHSEKRHRRDAGRISSGYQRAHEEGQNAANLSRRADAVGSGGISSDDPTAIEQLREKLAGLEKRRDIMKRCNVAWKASQKKPEVLDDGGKFSDLNEKTRAMLRDWSPPYAFVKRPFTYEITNIGANIRSTAKRIADLEESDAAEPHAEIVGNFWSAHENREENRVCVEFDAKPPREITKHMRSMGFVWNRTLVAWTRRLNPNCWAIVEYHAEKLNELCSTWQKDGAS